MAEDAPKMAPQAVVEKNNWDRIANLLIPLRTPYSDWVNTKVTRYRVKSRELGGDGLRRMQEWSLGTGLRL